MEPYEKWLSKATQDFETSKKEMKRAYEIAELFQEQGVPEEQISVAYLVGSSICIFPGADLLLEEVIDQIAGPIHRLLHIDWDFQLASSSVGVLRAFYDGIEITIYPSTRSCKVRGHQKQITVQRWQLDCTEETE